MAASLGSPAQRARQLFTDSQGQVLLARSAGPDPGHWMLPGGKVEPASGTPRRAAPARPPKNSAGPAAMPARCSRSTGHIAPTGCRAWPTKWTLRVPRARSGRRAIRPPAAASWPRRYAGANRQPS
ncbi:NUDIX hydrolase [Kitasatospora sp. GAS1066B]|uniref:NUDIX hydrolase n=1 Tax=Kitasatospora sp. GAS1066B TaxID=3156271 RepID=UPI00351336B1